MQMHDKTGNELPFQKYSRHNLKHVVLKNEQQWHRALPKAHP